MLTIKCLKKENIHYILCSSDGCENVTTISIDLYSETALITLQWLINTITQTSCYVHDIRNVYNEF